VTRARSYKNQRPATDVAKAHAQSKMNWRQWEKKIAAVLRVNDFWTFHLPALPTKELNKRLPKNLPDFIALGKPGSKSQGRLLVIEAKTGRATQTAGQSMVMSAFLMVTGVEGGVYYPIDYPQLVELAGGVEPL
jgi:hypothetical protein